MREACRVCLPHTLGRGRLIVRRRRIMLRQERPPRLPSCRVVLEFDHRSLPTAHRCLAPPRTVRHTRIVPLLGARKCEGCWVCVPVTTTTGDKPNRTQRHSHQNQKPPALKVFRHTDRSCFALPAVHELCPRTIRPTKRDCSGERDARIGSMFEVERRNARSQRRPEAALTGT